MTAKALKRRLDRLTDFAGGPPRPPYLAVERVIVKRDKDGTLWRKPYRRQVVGSHLVEMSDGPWERIDESDDDGKDPLEAEK